jgi:hypothetical protein
MGVSSSLNNSRIEEYDKMDILKALKRTTVISATVLFAFTATEAQAILDTSVQGHISASLQGTLGITETSAINFGNFSVGGGCATTCAGGATIALDQVGNRIRTNTADTITLLVGTANGANDLAGIADGSHLGTGGQAPGFYNITNGDTITNVYVSFSNSVGAIIDASHPNNYVSLTGPAGADTFRVAQFVWESDSAAATGPSSSGYTATGTDVTDPYGKYVACGASCNIRVGATLKTVAGTTPTPGQYHGTYYVMVSY